MPARWSGRAVRHKRTMQTVYQIGNRFATEIIGNRALLCEKSQIVVSARWFPATASDLRTKAKVFLQGCPLAPDHRVHDLEAVARRQSRRDCHGGNFAPKSADLSCVGFPTAQKPVRAARQPEHQTRFGENGRITLTRAGNTCGAASDPR